VKDYTLLNKPTDRPIILSNIVHNDLLSVD